MKLNCRAALKDGSRCTKKGTAQRFWYCLDHYRIVQKIANVPRTRRSFTEKDRKQVIEFYGTICYLCKEEIDIKQTWAIDHVMPFSKGGTDNIMNLRPTHMRCNSIKKDKIIDINEYFKDQP